MKLSEKVGKLSEEVGKLSEEVGEEELLVELLEVEDELVVMAVAFLGTG